MAAAATSKLEASVAQIAADLTDLEQAFALVGGLAVSAHGEPRFTRDVDVVVATSSDEDAERVVFELQARGYTVESSVEQTATGRLATVRTHSSRARDIIVDLLFASSGIEPEVVASAHPMEVFEGVRMPVATRTSLVALKVLSRATNRPQDDVDLAALLSTLTSEENADVEALLSVIAARGYGRGKRLVQEFRRLTIRWPSKSS